MFGSILCLILAGQLADPIAIQDGPSRSEGATTDEAKGQIPRGGFAPPRGPAAPPTPMRGGERQGGERQEERASDSAFPRGNGGPRNEAPRTFTPEAPVDSSQVIRATASEPSEREVEASPLQRPEGAVAEARRLWKATGAPREQGRQAELGGDELPLKACVRQRSLPSERREMVLAYWNLSHRFAVWSAAHQHQQRLDSIPQTEFAFEQQLLSAARTAAAARVATATVDVHHGQSELLKRTGWTRELRPVPVDAPLVDRYLTKLDQLYGSQPPLLLQRLEEQLIRRQTQLDALVTSTLAASEAWRLTEAAYRQGECSLAPLLQADALLYQQQLGFLESVLRYNQEIAGYAFEVGKSVQDPDVVVSMLIRNAVEPDPDEFPRSGLSREPNPVPLEPLPLQPLPQLPPPVGPPGSGESAAGERTDSAALDPLSLPPPPARNAPNRVVPASAVEPLDLDPQLPRLPAAVEQLPSVLKRNGPRP